MNDFTNTYITPRISDFLVDKFNSKITPRGNTVKSPRLQGLFKDGLMTGLDNHDHNNNDPLSEYKQPQEDAYQHLSPKESSFKERTADINRKTSLKDMSETKFLEEFKRQYKDLEYKLHQNEQEKSELKILIETQLNSLAFLQSENKKYKAKLKDMEKLQEICQQLNNQNYNLNNDLQTALQRINELEVENQCLLILRPADYVIPIIEKYTNYICSIIEGFNEGDFARDCFKQRFFNENYSIQAAIENKCYESIALKAYQYITDLLINIASKSTTFAKEPHHIHLSNLQQFIPIIPPPDHTPCTNLSARTSVSQLKMMSLMNSNIMTATTMTATSAQKDELNSISYPNYSDFDTEETPQDILYEKNIGNMGKNQRNQPNKLKINQAIGKPTKQIDEIFHENSKYKTSQQTKEDLGSSGQMKYSSDKGSLASNQPENNNPKLVNTPSPRIQSNKLMVTNENNTNTIAHHDPEAKESKSLITNPLSLKPKSPREQQQKPHKKPKNLSIIIPPDDNAFLTSSCNTNGSGKINKKAYLTPQIIPRLNLNALAQVKELDDELIKSTTPYPDRKTKKKNSIVFSAKGLGNPNNFPINDTISPNNYNHLTPKNYTQEISQPSKSPTHENLNSLTSSKRALGVMGTYRQEFDLLSKISHETNKIQNQDMISSVNPSRKSSVMNSTYSATIDKTKYSSYTGNSISPTQQKLLEKFNLL